MRPPSSKPLGYHYESCGVVLGSLDLESYDVFATKQKSQPIATDADLAQHQWESKQGNAVILKTNALHHTKDCAGPDCLLCSFEQELIRIGYHDRQAARKQNQKRFKQHVIKQDKETAAQNQEIVEKYGSMEVPIPDLDDQIIDQVAKSTSISTSRSQSKIDSIVPTGNERLVSSISDSRVCFNGPVPNGFEPRQKVEHEISYASPLKKLRQLYRQRRKSQAKEKPKQSFILRPLTVDKKSIRSTSFLGKVEPPGKDIPYHSGETNCKVLWKIDSTGSKLHKLDVGSVPKPVERYQARTDPKAGKTQNDHSAELSFSDDSTPKVLSPVEAYFDGPTPQSSCCDVLMNVYANEASKYINTNESLDQNSSSEDSRSSPDEYSGATSDQELCFEADFDAHFDDHEEVAEKCGTRCRATSHSAKYMRESCNGSPTVTQTSVIVLDSAKLKRSNGNMNWTYSSTRTSTPSYRINSAPTEYPSAQSKQSSPLRCPHTVAASHGLSSFLRQSRRKQEYFMRSPEFLAAATNGDGNHKQHSVPASPQTTPPQSRPTLRTVRSSPGMKFRTLSPVKCNLAPQNPRCKKKLDFVKGFSPYSVLPCVQDDMKMKACK